MAQTDKEILKRNEKLIKDSKLAGRLIGDKLVTWKSVMISKNSKWEAGESYDIDATLC